MHIQPGDALRRSQHDGQLQLCVPLVAMYGRSYPLLIDPTRDPLKFCQSLDASDAITRAAIDGLSDALGLS